VASTPAAGAVRPRPIAELLDDSFSLYRRNFPVLASVAVLLSLPALILNLVSGTYISNLVPLLQRFLNNPGDPAVLQAFTSSSQSLSPPYLLAALLVLVTIPFTFGALYQAAVAISKRERVTIGSVMRGTVRSYFAVFGLILLFGLFAVTGLLVVTLPLVIWIGVRWAVSTPALFAEGIGPVRALGRSWRLLEGQWWRTLGIVLLVSFMVSLIRFVLEGTAAAGAAWLPLPDANVRAALGTALAQVAAAFVSPLFPIVITLLYFDVRRRKEGIDLDGMARQAALGTASA
jgi:hypothetical protein